MNYLLKLKSAFLLLPLCLINDGAIGSPINNLVKSKPDTKFVNFNNIDSLYKKKIKSLNGIFFDKFQADLSSKYNGYLIIDACKAQFSIRTQTGYNMTIVDPEKKTGIYIVATSSKEKAIEIFELQRFNFDFSERGYIRGRAGENMCLSSKEIRDIQNDYSKINSRTGKFTNLNPRTNFDVACGTPEGGDMEFICFEYDEGQNKFRDIGGWQNE